MQAVRLDIHLDSRFSLRCGPISSWYTTKELHHSLKLIYHFLLEFSHIRLILNINKAGYAIFCVT